MFWRVSSNLHKWSLVESIYPSQPTVTDIGAELIARENAFPERKNEAICITHCQAKDDIVKDVKKEHRHVIHIQKYQVSYDSDFCQKIANSSVAHQGAMLYFVIFGTCCDFLVSAFGSY